ncbi:MAG: hypothetical protein IJ268_06040, partial [Proteobacteria bacterium]|nr:hypothetical protein [Pseudomonadota bacterium]
MKRFLLLSLALLFFPCQAHADQIDCKITVDFNSQSVRSAAVSTSAANALAKALETSCKKICPSSNTNDADCLDACIKYSSLSATECFTSDNVYVEANREAGRKRLISMRSPAKKSKSNIHIANWYGSKSDLLAPRATSDSALLLKNDIIDTKKFFWTIAHHTLSNYYRNSSKSLIGVSIDDFAERIADPGAEQGPDDNTEVIQRLWDEIA